MASVISGLGSGVDLQSIVTQLMNAERSPETQMNTLRLAALSTQTAWTGLATKLAAVQAAAKLLDTPVGVQSSTATSSDTSALTVTAGPGAQLGSVGVKVVRLATAQQLSSGALGAASMLVGTGQAVLTAGLARIGASTLAVDPTTTDGPHAITVTRASAKAIAAGTTGPALSFTAGNDDLTVTLADGVAHSISLTSYATAADLVNDLSTKLAGTAEVHLVAGQLQISSRDEGSGASLSLSGGAVAGLGVTTATTVGTDALVSLDGAASTTVAHVDAGTTVALGGGMTLTTGSHLGLGTAVVNVVRTTATSTLGDLTTKLSASGSPLTAALVDTGDGSTNPNRLVLSALATGSAGEVTVDATGINVLGTGQLSTVVAPLDAQLEVGGSTLTRSSNTLTDVITGVTLTLVKATAIGASPATVSVSRDAATTSTKAQSLIDAVNAVINDVKTQTAYNATTKKGGPLSGEGTARSLPSSLVGFAASATGSGSTKLLSQLGIQTSRDGTLTFDSTAFAAQVAKDPDGVANLLSGFAKSVEDYAKAAIASDGVITTSTTSAGAEVKRRQQQIDSFETRMTLLQTSYSRKFAALDAALGKLKAQQTAIASAISSLPLTP
jgi:flagellar hook-associated protein 2